MNIQASLSSSNRSAAVRWGWLRSNYDRARNAAEAYEQSTYQPATARLTKLVGACPPTRVTIYAEDGSAAVYTVWQADLFSDFTWFQPVREARRAYDRYLDRSRELEIETGWSAISDEMDRLDAVAWKARDMLMAEPAPDAQSLAFKLALAMEPEEFNANLREGLLCDARRLAAL